MTSVQSICAIGVFALCALTSAFPQDGKEVFAKTLYGEARGEPEEGQRWVAWVIKNRAAANKDYWGGSEIKNVCTKQGQFECWKGKQDIVIDEKALYDRIKRWTDKVYNAPANQDPTGGCTYFNNPDKEGMPDWTKNVQLVRKIGGHNFYKEK